MLSFFQHFSKKDGDGKTKSTWIVLVLATLGIALMLFGGSKLGTQEKKDPVYSPNEDEMILYQRHLEERVLTLCESVSGVSNVQVFIMLESGFENIYATEHTEDGERYVIIGSGSSAEPLYLARQAPSIQGIGIVCRGGSDPSVQHELTKLISAALNVASNRIYVSEAG